MIVKDLLSVWHNEKRVCVCTGLLPVNVIWVFARVCSCVFVFFCEKVVENKKNVFYTSVCVCVCVCVCVSFVCHYVSRCLCGWGKNVHVFYTTLSLSLSGWVGVCVHACVCSLCAITCVGVFVDAEKIYVFFTTLSPSLSLPLRFVCS